MDFGVVLQTDPPAWRVVDLARRAESLGFSYGWTFDSHVLWQEPFVVYSQMLSATNRMVVGPMVTNPGTRDWTVTGSLFATLNDMFGNRTVCGIGRGDSALRVIGHPPCNLATLREAMGVIKDLAEGRTATYNRTEQHFPWARASELKVLMAAYGPKALQLCGSETDGFILQLADPAIAEWTIAAVRRAAADAGRDPDSLYICVAAPGLRGPRRGPPAGAVPLVRRDGGQPRGRSGGPLRRPGRRRAPGPHRLHRGPPGLRLFRPRQGGPRPHRFRAR